MNNKREVFLFGAGAVIDWDGPKTYEITKLIRKSGFPLINSDTKITEFIYQRLLKAGYSESEINFETIINVIEELMVYFSEFNKKKKTSSLLKVFLFENDLSEIFNFSIKGGLRKHGYTLQIPIYKNYTLAKASYFDENPNQFFLQHLLASLLTTINNLVSKYSWNTENHSVIDKETKYSLTFRKWITSKNSILRLYTLNYDNLFKSLLEEENIECFDGFYESKDDYQSSIDVKRILSDTVSSIHYNLHGSSYWQVLSKVHSDIFSPEIVRLKGISLNSYPIFLEMEKGKTILVSNIITGYQKTQKSAITPFRQMQSAFDKDCLFADKITIIGYSFGDEHINEVIRTALRYNKKLRIEIIEPNFTKNNMDLDFTLNIFPITNQIDYEKNEENIYSYFDSKIKVFNMKFLEYLKYE